MLINRCLLNCNIKFNTENPDNWFNSSHQRFFLQNTMREIRFMQIRKVAKTLLRSKVTNRNMIFVRNQGFLVVF